MHAGNVAFFSCISSKLAGVDRQAKKKKFSFGKGGTNLESEYNKDLISISCGAL